VLCRIGMRTAIGFRYLREIKAGHSAPPKVG
jgi:hypothetical protein